MIILRSMFGVVVGYLSNSEDALPNSGYPAIIWAAPVKVRTYYLKCT
jgi:hypothetical protein